MKISDLIKQKPANERADIKGQEIAKIKSVPKTKVNFSDFECEIEIANMTPINGGVEVLARAWDANGQIGFGKDGSVDIERFRFINPPILVSDPLGDIVREETDSITGELSQRKLREDPQLAILQSLAHTISLIEKSKSRGGIITGKVGNTTLTAYPNAGTGTAPVDGWTSRNGGVDQTLANLRDGAGGADFGDTNDTPNMVVLIASTTLNQFSYLYRTLAGFNTSSIGTDNIDSAIISYAGTGTAELTDIGDTTWDITAVTPNSESAVIQGDYAIANWGATVFGQFTISNWVQTDGIYNDITLNASGLSNINKTGNTLFGNRIGWDTTGSFTGSWVSGARTRIIAYQADQAGTSSDPKLVVEHSAAAAAASNFLLMGV